MQTFAFRLMLPAWKSRRSLCCLGPSMYSRVCAIFASHSVSSGKRPAFPSPSSLLSRWASGPPPPSSRSLKASSCAVFLLGKDAADDGRDAERGEDTGGEAGAVDRFREWPPGELPRCGDVGAHRREGPRGMLVGGDLGGGDA